VKDEAARGSCERSKAAKLYRLKDDEPKGNDLALIHGRTADGTGLRIVRQREGRIELGAVRPLKEGVPISGEVVSLTPRPEFPLLCDVKVELAASTAPADTSPARHGPAQVATDRYRENWDRIWPHKEEPGLTN
jgi:hypothetical protein